MWYNYNTKPPEKGWRMSFRVNPQAVQARYDNQKTVLDLAKAYGVSYRAMYLCMLEHDIKLRPPGLFRDYGWAMWWRYCRKCGTTDSPHHCRGLCEKCHKRELRAREKALITLLCMDCSEPITRFSESGRCTRCSVKERKDLRKNPARKWTLC